MKAYLLALGLALAGCASVPTVQNTGSDLVEKTFVGKNERGHNIRRTDYLTPTGVPVKTVILGKTGPFEYTKTITYDSQGRSKEEIQQDRSDTWKAKYSRGEAGNIIEERVLFYRNGRLDSLDITLYRPGCDAADYSEARDNPNCRTYKTLRASKFSLEGVILLGSIDTFVYDDFGNRDISHTDYIRGGKLRPCGKTHSPPLIIDTYTINVNLY